MHPCNVIGIIYIIIALTLLYIITYFETLLLLAISWNWEMSYPGGTVEPGGKVEEPPCQLECKPLSMADYTDLLWTSVAEFPGQSYY